MIYFVQAGVDGPVKIGRAADINKRMSGLQTGSAESLTLLREVAGGVLVEKWLHKKFHEHAIRGEWFMFAPEMLTIAVPEALQDADGDCRKDQQLPPKGIAPEMERWGRLQHAYEKGIALIEQAPTSDEAFRAAIAWNEEIRRLEDLYPELHRMVEVFGKKPHASAVVARRTLTKAARSSDDGSDE